MVIDGLLSIDLCSHLWLGDSEPPNSNVLGYAEIDIQGNTILSNTFITNIYSFYAVCNKAFDYEIRMGEEEMEQFYGNVVGGSLFKVYDKSTYTPEEEAEIHKKIKLKI